MSLANGRRADVVGLSPAGDIWIVEVKSCLEDLRVDSKWPEYRDFSDALFFAVAPGFPVEILPADTGLILADRFGGEIVRPAPETRLAAARRKAMTLRFARAAAFSLQALTDPGFAKIPDERIKCAPDYFGARLARMRCKVRRCMLSRRAVSDTLRLHSS